MVEMSGFERAATSLGLDEPAKARAWEKLRAARIGPEDPEAIRILLNVCMEEDANRLREVGDAVVERATGAIANAVKASLAGVVDAAAKVERASAATLQKTQAQMVLSVGERVADAADAALTRKVRVLARNTLAGWLLAAGLTAAAVGAGGYLVGKRNVEANVVEVSTMLRREDGAAWRTMMAQNDMANALATWCRNGSANVRRVDGGTICSVPLWIARDATVGRLAGQAADGRAVLDTVSSWLAAWGPWWLLGAGAFGLLLLRKLSRGLAQWPPVAWLLDMPPRPVPAGE